MGCALGEQQELGESGERSRPPKLYAYYVLVIYKSIWNRAYGNRAYGLDLREEARI
jgi:hypothetical protein